MRELFSSAVVALAVATTAILSACSDDAPTSAPQTPSTVSASKGPFDGPKSVPTRGRILFVSDLTGDLEVYSINEDGTGVVRLTYSPAQDGVPSFSPDGSRIAFLSDRGGTRQVYVMNADGSGVKRLTNIPDPSSPVTRPAWSPDGKQIAFSVQSVGQQDQFNVYVMNASGSGLRQLTFGDENVGPVFAPDGKRIAFTSRTASGAREIFTMNADGTQVAQLTNCAVVLQIGCERPSWSPDGSRIAFSTTGGNLWILRLSDNSLTSIAPGGSGPIWAPDGVKLVFTLNGSPFDRVATINVDGTGIQELTSYAATTAASSWGRR